MISQLTNDILNSMVCLFTKAPRQKLNKETINVENDTQLLEIDITV